MKKIVLFLASLGLIDSLHACLCAGDIVQGFNTSTNSISEVLTKAETEISSNVIPSIQQNIKDIDEQNKQIEKIITVYKERNIQKKELIFLLTQLKQIQD